MFQSLCLLDVLILPFALCSYALRFLLKKLSEEDRVLCFVASTGISAVVFLVSTGVCVLSIFGYLSVILWQGVSGFCVGCLFRKRTEERRSVPLTLTLIICISAGLTSFLCANARIYLGLLALRGRDVKTTRVYFSWEIKTVRPNIIVKQRNPGGVVSLITLHFIM